jgi:hypothetical protein
MVGLHDMRVLLRGRLSEVGRVSPLTAVPPNGRGVATLLKKEGGWGWV